MSLDPEIETDLNVYMIYLSFFLPFLEHGHAMKASLVGISRRMQVLTTSFFSQQSFRGVFFMTLFSKSG